jgi:LacI family transcriptional regulator
VATIQDVARLAGVSTATASRAISGYGYVSPASRDQVLAAADELGYVPNRLARGLKTRQSGLVALLVPEIVNSFYTTIARGVEDVANANGLQIIVGNTDENVAKERAYTELMVSTHVDGIVIAPASGTARTLKPLQTARAPAVLVDRSVPGFAADLVRGDNAGGARTLTDHLLALGHTRVALVNGNPTTSVAREREEGFRLACTAAGVMVDDRLISNGTWFAEDAAARTGEILDQPDPPTAVLATNNFMAIGAFRALRERGLRVPDDVAVVSYDDIPDAAEIDPFLTALAQPAYSMGTIAMQLLLERIGGSFRGEPREVTLSPRLLVRRSCGAAHAATHSSASAFAASLDTSIAVETALSVPVST